MAMDSSELIKQILPLLLPQIEGLIQGATVGGSVPSPHDLNSSHHAGVLADSQAPQFLKLDGSRDLTGNLTVSPGITIDGLDLSAMQAGAVSAASTNSGNLSGAHTHAVTASASPGASASLLKTTGAGLLTLQALTVATAPTLSAFSTVGGLLYTNGSGLMAQANLIWDNATSRFGVNRVPTTNPLEVQGAASTTGNLIAGTNVLLSGYIQMDAATPKIYMGTGGSELGRYLHIANSSALDTPVQAKMGGLLVADNFAYASPGKNDVVIKGGLTIAKQVPVYASATWPLEVWASGMVIGSDPSTATTKTARYAGAHYTTAEEPLVGMLLTSNSSANIVAIGGGTGNSNAATELRFYTAANQTTLTGTEVARVTGAAGLWGIGVGNTTPIGQLDVQSTGENLRLRYNVNNYATLNTLSTGTLELVTVGSTPATAGLTLKPGGSLTLFPSPSTATGDVLPNANYRVNLGSLTSKFLALHAAELWVETLVAQETIATIGGRILVGPTTTLTRDRTAVNGAIFVKHNQMVLGDRVYLEANGKIEFMRIASGPTTISGTPPNTEYSYDVDRNQDGTGASTWNAGDAVFNTGQTGNGWIDLYSVRGLKYTVAGMVKTWSQFGPAIVMNVRNSNTFNDWSEHAAFGNLRGVYGYGSDTYGVAFGKYAGSGTSYITIDAANGYRVFNGSTVLAQWSAAGVITVGDPATGHVRIDAGVLRLRHNTTDKITLDASGNLTMVGVLSLGSSGGVYQGTGTFAAPTTGLKIWNDTGVGRIGGYNAGTLQWYGGTDGKLYAGAGSVVLDAGGIVLDPGTSFNNMIRWGSAGKAYSMAYDAGGAMILQLQASGLGSSPDQAGMVRLEAMSAVGVPNAYLEVGGVGSGEGERIRLHGILERESTLAWETNGGIYFAVQTPITHATYTNATVAVGGWTAIPLSGFTPALASNVIAVHVRLTAQFSAAANTNWIGVAGSSSGSNYPVLVCRGIVAGMNTDQTGIVAVDPNAGTPCIWVKVNGAVSATGVYIQVFGFFL